MDTTPLSPEQWLDRLTLRLDLRAPRLKTLRSYIDGNAPLPEGAVGKKEAFAALQKKARTNFGELIIEAVVERMIVSGFVVNPPDDLDGSDTSTSTSDETEPAEADNDHCRAIWKRNRLEIGISDVLRDMLGVSAGYFIVGQDSNKKAVITQERPEQVITEQDAQYPINTVAGLKVYRDPMTRRDTAFLHLAGTVYTYERASFVVVSSGIDIPLTYTRGGWTLVDEQETGLDFVPVFPFLNRGGIGEFEAHTDLLDRIMWDTLQRLVITSMQAFRQRWLKGELPINDEAGNKIDYEKMFAGGAGAIWNLPDGVDIGESQQTDMTSLLNASKDDIRHLAAVTRTPLPMLIPEAANQSAEGARAAEKGLIFKTSERIARASAVLARVMEAALAIEDNATTLDGSVEVIWEDPERQSLIERADAAIKLNSIVPWRTLMTDVLGFSSDRVDEMEAEKAADYLKAWIMNPPPSSVRETLAGTIAAPTADGGGKAPAPAGPGAKPAAKPAAPAPAGGATEQ